MIVSIIFLLALIGDGEAYVLARRAEQQIEDRATYQGGWALSNPSSCPANYSVACGSPTDVNQLCCPQGNTCFGGSLGYCCPTSQDCRSYVDTFSACADPSANMYISGGGYFCCAQGLTAVIPTSGYPFCETADVSVAASLLATIVSQYGATAMATPTVTGSATNTGAGIVTATPPTQTHSSTSPTSTSTSDPILDKLGTAGLIGVSIGALILICIALSIWRCLKRTVKSSIEKIEQRSYAAGPSMVPEYIPTNVPIYEPAPIRLYDLDVYDPVNERHTLISSMSPVPVTPSPAYNEVNYESQERSRMYEPIDTN